MMANYVRVYVTLLKRDILLALRNKADVLTALFFFMIVVSLFPLAISLDKNLLVKIAPGVAWVAALLASILVLDRLFSQDYADGTLEQMLLSPNPLVIIVMAKITAHWLLTGLPLVLISPWVGLLYHLNSDTIIMLMLALLLGTPMLSLLGAVGAALTLGLRSGSVLIALLVLPLYVPILVFGTGMVNASRVVGVDVSSYGMLLSGLLLLALMFVPWAVAAALRVAAE